MGAKVFGAGTNTITVYGVKKLFGCHYTPISDRIVAGTYLIACAMCGGKLLLKNVNTKHFSILVNKFSQKLDISMIISMSTWIITTKLLT